MVSGNHTRSQTFQTETVKIYTLPQTTGIKKTHRLAAQRAYSLHRKVPRGRDSRGGCDFMPHGGGGGGRGAQRMRERVTFTFVLKKKTDQRYLPLLRD